MPGIFKLRRAAPYLAALLAAGLLYALTFQFAGATRPGTLGPAFWPRAAIALMAIVAVIEIVRIAIGAAADPIARLGEEDASDSPRHPALLLGGMALVAVYAASIATLGYVIASLAFLIAFMYLGRYRNHRVIWAASLLGMAAIAFIFLKVVYVSLPRGTAPFDGLTEAALGLIGIR